MSVVAIASSAICALGPGPEALRPPPLGGRAKVGIGYDGALAAAGLARPIVGRISPQHLDAAPTGEAIRADPATAQLAICTVEIAAQLDRAHPGWRTGRVGVVLGTSSGGMTSMEAVFRHRAQGVPIDPQAARRATYFGPLEPACAAAGLDLATLSARMQILAACAASTFAIGVAMRWLERGAADLVLAGGYDALALLVASGFEALRATTATLPAPFRVGRDGMALGEGAGLLALVRAADAGSAAPAFAITGFGAATDAVHVTAPDRTGDGLARAIDRALADAGRVPRDVVLVSAHATATTFNDAMEARALQRSLGEGANPVVQPLKAQIGHALGAAGVLETIAAAEALRLGIAPPAAGSGEIDEGARVRLLAVAEPLDQSATDQPVVLKLSAAFGGSNAALVLERAGAPPPRTRQRRRVFLSARARVAGADGARAALDRAAVPLERRSRLDSLSLVACGAVAELAAGGAPLEGAGVVAGHALATLDVDERFHRRVMARGPAAAEPRLFPATSPNLCAGHAAILFRLTGPSAATCGGLDGGTEALALAVELVAAGDADRMVVVAVDEPGDAGLEVLRVGFPEVHAPAIGAVAALVTADPRGALAEISIDVEPRHDGPLVGHEALSARLEALVVASARP